MQIIEPSERRFRLQITDNLQSKTLIFSLKELCLSNPLFVLQVIHFIFLEFLQKVFQV